MKSVLHFRLDSAGYNSDGIMKGFIENGYQYHGLNWQAERYNNSIEYVRKKAIEMAAEIKPAIIFCHLQNSEIFDAETWKKLSNHGLVVNYSFDVRQPEKMQWMYDAAPLIGYTFFGCAEDVMHCLKNGIENVGHLHSSCDMDLYKPNNKHGKFAFDVVFCGNRYDNTNLEFPLATERQQMIECLKNHYKDKFMSYGLGQQGGLLRPEVEAVVYNHSKIAICQNNFDLIGYTSDRIWRVMASGTMCLTKYFDGIETIFQKEVHCDWFKDFDEMILLADYYLSNEEERKSVAEAGMKLVREQHRWKDRIMQIEKIIGGSE
jgi:spore maturation protein CgeB